MTRALPLVAAALLALPATAQEALLPGETLPTPAPAVARGGGVTITQNASTDVAGGGVACAASTGTPYTTDNSYLRVFDLSTYALGGPLNVTDLDVGIFPVEMIVLPSVDTEVILYTMTGGVDYSSSFSRTALTEVAREVLTITDNDLPGTRNVAFTVPPTVQPTDTLVVEWAAPDGTAPDSSYNLRYGRNDAGQTGPTYLSTDYYANGSCGGIPPTNVAALGDFGSLHWVLVVNGELATSSEGGATASRVSLGGSTPNPVVSAGAVRFSVREATHVRLAVYDVLGREMAVLADAAYAAGDHTAALDAGALPAGTYVVRLEAQGEVYAQPFTVAR